MYKEVRIQIDFCTSSLVQYKGTQIDFSGIECICHYAFSQTLLNLAFLELGYDIIADFVTFQQHTFFKVSNADVNSTLEYKISDSVL